MKGLPQDTPREVLVPDVIQAGDTSPKVVSFSERLSIRAYELGYKTGLVAGTVFQEAEQNFPAYLERAEELMPKIEATIYGIGQLPLPTVVSTALTIVEISDAISGERLLSGRKLSTKERLSIFVQSPLALKR